MVEKGTREVTHEPMLNVYEGSLIFNGDQINLIKVVLTNTKDELADTKDQRLAAQILEKIESVQSE